LKKSSLCKAAVITAFLLLCFPGHASPASKSKDESAQPPGIILFIGDGMGEAHRTAGRWFAVGQDGKLTMDTLYVSGWSMTCNAVGGITDSAAAATAMATGQKTLDGYLSIGTDLLPLTTILEQAKAMGWSVGLVSTVRIAHATPAAFAAHVADRYLYTEIALQMIQNRVDVLLAGGENDFLPAAEQGCFPSYGHRTDGRNLIAEAQADGYRYVCSAAALSSLDTANTNLLLGLFADNGMMRPYEPTLAQMTGTAISILSQDPDGFFLMVEGGQIDWAGHQQNAQNVIEDVLGLDAAISIGMDYFQENDNTLVIVTADHETGGMSIQLDSSGEISEDGPFFTPDGTSFYVNWNAIGHTGVNVPTTAQGRYASLLSGTYENTHIYDVMWQLISLKAYMPLVSR
jgi:alkaline phosphatase